MQTLQRVPVLRAEISSKLRLLISQCRSTPCYARRAQSTVSSRFASRPVSRITGSRSAQRRLLTTNTQQRPAYEAVVIGAGAAGITCVGNLHQRGVQPILWVDSHFSGGRISASYREVPSNTKVKLFKDYATGTWSKAGEAGYKDQALSMFDGLDSEKGCDLSHAADMLLMLTQGLKETPGIDTRLGKMESGVFDEDANAWQVSIDSGNGAETMYSKRLVLATGSSPNNSPLPVDIPLNNIDLDDALSPTKLAKIVSDLDQPTVAVVGASHSAVLILRNLYNLARTGSGLKIKWFTRHDLRYAEFMDGWILRDNTGLKGEAATWARENLEPETLPKSDVSRYIQKITYPAGKEKETFSQHLKEGDSYVQAIGFSRDPIPSLTTSKGKTINPRFDHQTGSFTFDEETSSAKESKSKIPGLYGAGIAWPERVTDPYGNVEYAVGFFKFLKFVKRVSPQWN